MSTKQKILDAAIKVLVEKGLPAMTQTRIAEEAGLGQGHLTYYFPTRSKLLKAVVEESKKQMMGLQPDAQPSLTIEKMQQMAQTFGLSSDIPKLMLALTVATDEDPELAEWFASNDKNNRANIRRLLHDIGLEVDDIELHLLRASIVGASLINLQQGSAASAETAKKVIQAAFARLIANARPIKAAD